MHDEICVIEYKTLKYFYACRKHGIVPLYEDVKHLCEVNESYLATVLSELQEHDYIKGVEVQRFIDGEYGVAFIEPIITSWGVQHLEENSTFEKVKKALEYVIERSIEAILNNTIGA